MDTRPVIKVLTASERGEVHLTIGRALSLLGDVGAGQEDARLELLRADGASETLSLASAEQPRVVFLDVTIGGGAGIGLVHFLQSVVAGVVVIAIVPEGEGRDVRLVEQAASLGASWVLLGELTGDDVLRAFGRVAPAFARSSPPPAAAPPRDAPDFGDEQPETRRASALSEARTFAELETSLVVMQASLPADDPRVGLARELRAAVERCVAAERSTRTTIQDAATSAYSFSYFVDLAGREIDLARRHGRRFALATVDASEGYDVGQLIELVLSAVRDTDIVARADERELLLLLPETGSKGARTLRRRVLDRAQQLAGPHKPAPVRVGIASFPFDGEDLSRLLRIARRRAERWCSWDASPAAHRLLRDAIGWLSQPHRAGELPEHLRGEAIGPLVPIEVPLREGWALFDTIVREATRAGDATIAIHSPHDATESSLGLSQGIRAAMLEALGPSSSAQQPPPRSERDRDVLSLMTGVSRLTELATFAGLEVVGVLAEHACYGLLGRVDGGRLIALQTHDLPLVEALVNGLEQPVFRRGTLAASPSSAAPTSVRSSRTDPTAFRR